MQTRYSDIIFRESDQSDFIVRKRTPFIWQLAILFAITFGAIYLTAEAMNTYNGRYIFLGTLIIIILALAWFTLSFAQKNRDMVLVTEFQNALFASAAGLSTRFCLIARRDGNIVYFDPGFQKTFPGFLSRDLRTVDALFEMEKVPQETTQKILHVLQSGGNEKVKLDIQLPNGGLQPMLVSIDTLPRPKGYYLLRGREFVEHRGVQVGSGVPPVLFAELLHSVDAGLYVTDHLGSLVFINRPLEAMLGYDVGEIITGGLSLPDLTFELTTPQQKSWQPSDFEGIIGFRTRDGQLINTRITQRTIRGLSAEVIGCTGTVMLPVADK